MRKYLYLWPLITILNLSALSQTTQRAKIDSLRNQTLILKGNDKSDCLNLLAQTFSTGSSMNWKQKSDSVFYYATKAYEGAKQLNYKKGMASALTNQALSEWLKGIYLRTKKRDDGNTLTAMEKYLSQAIPLAQQIEDDNILGYAYELWSDMESKSKSPDPEIQAKYFKKAIDHFHKAGNDHKEGEDCLYQAERYMARGYYEEAIDYLQRALELNKKSLPKASTKEEKEYYDYLYQQSLADMADLYKTAGDFKTALGYVNQGAQFALLNNTGWNMESEKAELHRLLGQSDSSFYYFNRIRTYDQLNKWVRLGIGATFLQTNQYDSALLLFKQVLPEFRKVDVNGRVLIPALLNMGCAYAGKKEYKTALPYVREGIGYALKHGARPDVMTAYELLSRIHYNLGEADSAYQYLLKYIALKDSIQNKQFIFRLNSYKKTAEEERKTSQINLLNKDNQLKEQKLKQEAVTKKSLVAGLVLLSLLAVVIFRALTLKRKSELEKQRLESEKKQAELQQRATELEMQALRAQMNPHFIFNCLSSINKFILKNDTDTASDYLTRFSRLIRQSLINSQLSLIPLSDEIETLRLYLDMERLRFSDAFRYNITYENSIEPETVYIPPMVLQPFCENAIWHGLMHKEGAGKLEVILSLEDGVLTCIVADNGIGRAKAAELRTKSNIKQKSFGLKITTERLALYNNERSVQDFYTIEDILDANGDIAGTKVVLKLKIKNPVHQQAKETV